MADVQCPYCGEELDVCHDEGQNYSEDGELNSCDGCDKEIMIFTSVSYYYESGCKPKDHDLIIDFERINSEGLEKYRDSHYWIECKREFCNYCELVEKKDIGEHFTSEQLKEFGITP